MRSCTAPSWSATCMSVPSAAITCAWLRATGWSAFSTRARPRKSAPPSHRRIRSSSATASATGTGSPRRRKRPARVMPWWCWPAPCTGCRSWPAHSNSSSSAVRWVRWSGSASSAAWTTASRSGGRTCAFPPAAGRGCKGGRLRPLEQRNKRLLPARPAAGGKAHVRPPLLDAVVHAALEALPDHRTHRTAEELEFECAGHDRQRVQGAGQHYQGITLAGRFLRLGEPLAVALAVAELERILRRDGGADFRARARVEKALQPFARTHAHVMAALRTDIQVALQLGAVQDRIARRALYPQALRDRARAPFGLDAGGHDLLEPGHWGAIIADRAGAPPAGTPPAAQTRPDSAPSPDTVRRRGRWRHFCCGHAPRALRAPSTAARRPCRWQSAGPRCCASCGAGRRWRSPR